MTETSAETRLKHIEQAIDGWEEKRESVIPDSNPVAKKTTGMLLDDIRAIVEDDYHKTFLGDEE
jgi:hypothetical protein